MRRLIALGLAFVGIALGVIAIVGYLNMPSDLGDTAAIESALVDPPELSTTTTSVPRTTTTSVSPRWFPNEVSLLTELRAGQGPRPERLNIATLDIDAPVRQYGVTPDGQMDVPDNITEVGWYEFGPSPGEPGSAVLAAHVDLAGPGRGLFYHLDELEIGDEVQVSFDDGTSRSFRVVGRSTYLKGELPLDAIFSRSGDPILTLVTCGGGFSRSAGRYDSNVVVYAVPVDTD